MSWKNNVQDTFVIKTGDGRTYTPLWKNDSTKEIDFNIAQFDFPKVQGSKIDRGTPMARKFSLHIYFQGDDNLVTALNFEISSRDPRPWNISHPIYGKLLVQPTSLKFDFSGFNSCDITGTLLETLGSAGLKITIDPSDKIRADKDALDQRMASAFAERTALLKARGRTVGQLNGLTVINNKIYAIGSKAMKLTEDAGTYLDKFNVANATIAMGLDEASIIMQNLQAVINFPGQMVNSLKIRVGVITSQFATLRANLGIITRQSDKINYEATSGTLMGSMCTNVITDTDLEFKTKNDVLAQVEEIQAVHDQYIADIDSLMTPTGGTEDSYVPDAESIQKLNDLVSYTISNLYNIALTAKQERVIVLEDDSNPIVLAHRFYGLLPDDSTIALFMDNNNIGLNEILQIRKGRTLSFYI